MGGSIPPLATKQPNRLQIKEIQIMFVMFMSIAASAIACAAIHFSGPSEAALVKAGV